MKNFTFFSKNAILITASPIYWYKFRVIVYLRETHHRIAPWSNVAVTHLSLSRNFISDGVERFYKKKITGCGAVGSAHRSGR